MNNFKKISSLLFFSFTALAPTLAKAEILILKNASQYCVRAYNVNGKNLDLYPGFWGELARGINVKINMTQFKTRTCGGAGRQFIKTSSGGILDRITWTVTNDYYDYTITKI